MVVHVPTVAGMEAGTAFFGLAKPAKEGRLEWTEGMQLHSEKERGLER